MTGLRPATADDLAEVTALIRTAEAHDGVSRVLAEDELAEELEGSGGDLAADARVAVDGGEIVGWAYVWNPPTEAGIDRAELNGEVAPSHRRKGIGRALLQWSIDRAKERLASHDHDRPRAIRVNSYDWREDRDRLYRRHGFTPVRWHDELLRPLDGLPPLGAPPAGISLIPWPDERDEELRAVRNAAFADHWGSMVVEPGLWREFTRGHGARQDLSVAAVDDATGTIVGLCLNHAYPEDEEVTGRRDAWVANVCTLREARSRGIASAMLVWSLHAFADAGFDHAALDVDTDNPTGAARLYRGLGFEPYQRSVTYDLGLGLDAQAVQETASGSASSRSG